MGRTRTLRSNRAYERVLIDRAIAQLRVQEALAFTMADGIKDVPGVDAPRAASHLRGYAKGISDAITVLKRLKNEK